MGGGEVGLDNVFNVRHALQDVFIETQMLVDQGRGGGDAARNDDSPSVS